MDGGHADVDVVRVVVDGGDDVKCGLVVSLVVVVIEVGDSLFGECRPAHGAEPLCEGVPEAVVSVRVVAAQVAGVGVVAVGVQGAGAGVRAVVVLASGQGLRLGLVEARPEGHGVVGIGHVG